jgi:hypothetical protein
MLDQNVPRHQQRRRKKISFNFQPFGTRRGSGVALQDRIGEMLVNMDGACDVIAVQLQVRNFVRDCETLTIGMVQGIDADDGNAVPYADQSGQFFIQG